MVYDHSEMLASPARPTLASAAVGEGLRCARVFSRFVWCVGDPPRHRRDVAPVEGAGTPIADGAERERDRGLRRARRGAQAGDAVTGRGGPGLVGVARFFRDGDA